MIHSIDLWLPTVNSWTPWCDLDFIFVEKLGFKRDGDIFYYGNNKDFGYKITYQKDSGSNNAHLVMYKCIDGTVDTNAIFSINVGYDKYHLDYAITENGVAFGLTNRTSSYSLEYYACMGTNITNNEKISCYMYIYNAYLCSYNELNEVINTSTNLSSYTATLNIVSLAPIIFRQTPIVLDNFYIPSYSYADYGTIYPFAFKMNNKNYVSCSKVGSSSNRVVIETID